MYVIALCSSLNTTPFFSLYVCPVLDPTFRLNVRATIVARNNSARGVDSVVLFLLYSYAYILIFQFVDVPPTHRRSTRLPVTMPIRLS
jgi:hypothetical protein